MKIQTLSLCGFRCFKNRADIELSDFSTFIGTNGAGKSSILDALSKMFSIKKSERAIFASDFYVPVDGKLEDKDERALYIEVKVVFPELAENDEQAAVASCFKHMLVSEPKERPYCRIRLNAIWHNTNIAGGEIESKMFWITSSNEDFDESSTHPFTSVDYSKIHMHYIPATREPLRQIKQTAGSVMATFIKSVKFSEGFHENFKELTSNLCDLFLEEKGINTLQSELTEIWSELFTSKIYTDVCLKPVSQQLDEILSKVEIVFSPSEIGGELSLDRLSDGLRSLFYFALIKCFINLENLILNSEDSGFESSAITPPLLTIIAIEEPENHLSPHYMSRILKTFREISEEGAGQVLITSHSPSILKRIEPEEIRYVRSIDGASCVKPISLPVNDDDAFKYVKEAVKAYPEIYFSKCVVFGEGDSEEIVLPKVAAAYDFSFDESFVSVVPLGGRHVNHFWKLCEDLEIPYVTLLDYDNYRDGGNWGRIKHALEQLIANGYDKKELLKQEDGTLVELHKMHTFERSKECEKSWKVYLKRYDIFFSSPYDIDFMMLSKFIDAYTKLETSQKGPTITQKSDNDYEKKTKVAVASVRKLEPSEINLKDDNDYSLYFWYRYLFLGRGKPISHLKALMNISKQDLKDNCPSVLKRLIEAVKKKVNI